MRINNMRKIFLIATIAALAYACGNDRHPNTDEPLTVISSEQALDGDSTIYGLACDGCTDSLLIFLPYSGGDPDTIDILEARLSHKMFGRPRIGDRMAVILASSRDSSVAAMVVNLDELKGRWCYTVMPEFKRRTSGLEGEKKASAPHMPDSVRKLFMQPREYGFELKRDYSASPIGLNMRNRNDAQSPVVYPVLKRYHEWRLFNGQLILTETRIDTTGNTQITGRDTAQLILLRHDTLRLRFSSGEQGYYRH